MARRKHYHTGQAARYTDPTGILSNAVLREALRCAPFRSVLSPWLCAVRDIPPPAAVLVLAAGEPVTPAAVFNAADEVEQAHAAGHSALILSTDKEQRDGFRDALVALLGKRAAARAAVIGGSA